MAANSTQHIIKTHAFLLEKKEEKSDSPRAKELKLVLCPVQLSFSHKRKLQRLNEEHHWGLTFPVDEKFDLECLEQEFKRVCQLEDQIKNNKKKLLLKQYKLTILKSYLKFLQSDKNHPVEEIVEKPSAWRSFSTRLHYGFLLLAGILSESIGSFLGSEDIISVIPAISDAGIMIVTISLSIINAALFYIFEATAVRESMGLDSLDNLGVHLAADEEEMEVTNEINKVMSNEAINKLGKADYKARAKLTDTLNKAIQNKKQFQKTEIPEKLSRKILRYAVRGLGALMVGFNGFFVMKALLLSLAPALMATPAGPIFIVAGISVMLVYFFAVKGKAVLGLLNPSMAKFKEVKAKHGEFSPQTELALNKLYDERNDKTTIQQVRNENQALRRENIELKKTLLEHNLKFKKSPEDKGPAPSPSSINQGSQGLWRRASVSASSQDKAGPKIAQPQTIPAARTEAPLFKW